MQNKFTIAAFALASVLCTGAARAQAAPMPTGDTSAQDTRFLRTASQGGLTEIEESRIALRRSKNPEVKAFAQEMVTDHGKMLSDLVPFEQKMGVQPATKLNQAHMQEASRLRTVSGSRFDMEYVKAMVADHHKDRGAFRSERDTTSNPDLKATVSSAYDTIKEHTDKIDAIATSMNVPVPANSAPIGNPAQ